MKPLDMGTAKITRLRRALRGTFGERKYRISDGQVHIYGRMPNSNMIGWWLFGDVSHAAKVLGLQSIN